MAKHKFNHDYCSIIIERTGRIGGNAEAAIVYDPDDLLLWLSEIDDNLDREFDLIAITRTKDGKTEDITAETMRNWFREWADRNERQEGPSLPAWAETHAEDMHQSWLDSGWF